MSLNPSNMRSRQFLTIMIDLIMKFRVDLHLPKLVFDKHVNNHHKGGWAELLVGAHASAKCDTYCWVVSGPLGRLWNAAFNKYFPT